MDCVRPFRFGYEYFKADLVSLHFMTETQPVGELDSIYTRMIESLQLPQNALHCADGTFTGESLPDAYDYRHIAQIKIKHEKIVWIDYDEISRDGQGKEKNRTYCEQMNPAGTNPSLAYPVMEKELLDTQDVSKVDGLTGASYSRYRFRYAVMIALIRARLSNNAPA